MGKRTEDLGTAPLAGLILRLGVPGVVGMLVMSLYNVIDTFWVSGLEEGTLAIAALAIAFPIQMIAGAIGIGTGMGVGSLAARRFGARRLDEVGLVAGHAVALPFWLGIPLTAVAVAFAPALVHAFGAPLETVGFAVTYLKTVAFGFPFLIFAMTVNGLYRGSGNTVMPMTLL